MSRLGPDDSLARDEQAVALLSHLPFQMAQWNVLWDLSPCQLERCVDLWGAENSNLCFDFPQRSMNV